MALTRRLVVMTILIVAFSYLPAAAQIAGLEAFRNELGFTVEVTITGWVSSAFMQAHGVTLSGGNFGVIDGAPGDYGFIYYYCPPGTITSSMLQSDTSFTHTFRIGPGPLTEANAAMYWGFLFTTKIAPLTTTTTLPWWGTCVGMTPCLSR